MTTRIASRYLASSLRAPHLISASFLRPNPSLPRTLQPVAHRFAHTIPRPPPQGGRRFPSSSSSSSQSPTDANGRRTDPHYKLIFTCVPCGGRSSHTVSKQGYHRGSVLITCPTCRNRHVISDNLNIFGDRKVTVEDILREKGQLVKRGTLGEDRDIEFWPDYSPADPMEDPVAEPDKSGDSSIQQTQDIGASSDRYDGSHQDKGAVSEAPVPSEGDDFWDHFKDKLLDERGRTGEDSRVSWESTSPDLGEDTNSVHSTPSTSGLTGGTGARPSAKGTAHTSYTPSTRRQYHIKKFIAPKSLQMQDTRPLDGTVRASQVDYRLGNFQVLQERGSGTRWFRPSRAALRKDDDLRDQDSPVPPEESGNSVATCPSNDASSEEPVEDQTGFKGVRRVDLKRARKTRRIRSDVEPDKPRLAYLDGKLKIQHFPTSDRVRFRFVTTTRWARLQDEKGRSRHLAAEKALSRPARLDLAKRSLSWNDIEAVSSIIAPRKPKPYGPQVHIDDPHPSSPDAPDLAEYLEDIFEICSLRDPISLDAPNFMAVPEDAFETCSVGKLPSLDAPGLFASLADAFETCSFRTLPLPDAPNPFASLAIGFETGFIRNPPPLFPSTTYGLSPHPNLLPPNIPNPFPSGI